MVLHSTKYICGGDVQVPVMQVGSTNVKYFDWTKMPFDLPMGQKDDLLLRSSAKASGFTKVHKFNSFEQSTSSFASQLSDGRIAKVSGEVVSVKKMAKKEILCRVKTLQGYQEVVCEQLIGSLGAGQEREVEIPTQYRDSQKARPFHELTTGIKSLTGVTPMIFGSVIVLFGDGPTVLWNALAYRKAGNTVIVIGPPSLEAFAASNPGGRNSDIYEALLAEDRLWTGIPEGLVQRDNIKYFADPSEPGMLLHMKNMRSIATGKELKSFVIPTAQIVSSIGSIPRTLDMFDASSRNDFFPIIMSGMVEKDYGVAINNTDGDIVVIGAAAVDASGDFMARSLFAEGGMRIAQPDKGILATRHAAQMVQNITELRAMGGELGNIGSAMKNLSRSLEMDPYTANSLQFAQFLSDYGMPESSYNELIPVLIKHREERLKRAQGFSNYDLIEFLETQH